MLQKGLQAIQAPLAIPDTLEVRAPQEALGALGPQDILDQLEPRVLRAHRGQRGQQVTLARLVLRGRLEMLE